MALQHAYNFEAIGTQWAIETDSPLSKNEVSGLHAIINDFDAAYSRFRPDSLVLQARDAAPGTFAFPGSIQKLFDTYTLLDKITQGAINPLAGQSLEHLGYDANYSLRPHTGVLVPAKLPRAILRSGNNLTYHLPKLLLDIGAIGKGYLVDAVAAYVARHHTQYVIDAGGDIAVKTNQPYVIGLEHPHNLDEVIGTVSLQQQSICGSSPNRRNWGKGLHHIIDARTGKPLESNITATWAITQNTMEADALATALFFVPAKKLQTHFGDFKYVIMKADLQIEHNIA